MAAALAARGMQVAIHHHASQEGATALRDEIVAAGGRAACFGADLADASAARALGPRVVEALGGLDVLVNSAAIMERLGFEDTSIADYDRVMDLNLRSVFFVTQGAAPALRAARGVVVNIADLGGLEPWPLHAAHSVSKAGVVMLTRVLALALAPEVRVNAIAPGAVLLPASYGDAERDFLVRTTPLARLGDADDVVQALEYLLDADYVSGEVLTVDGGRRLRGGGREP